MEMTRLAVASPAKARKRAVVLGLEFFAGDMLRVRVREGGDRRRRRKVRGMAGQGAGEGVADWRRWRLR
jgi:hypothetical protein